MAGAAATPPAMMRAVQYDASGGGAAGLKHVEVPVPSAKKNEVLLKLEAATINPVDWKIQKGMLRPLLPRRLPFIPVTDFSGMVAGVGPGVNDFAVGDQVFAMLNSMNGGGLAEYAVAAANLTVKRTPNVSAAEGAGLPIAAGTALQALRSIGAKFDGTGEPLNVLVTAASGGVGLYAVQLAKLANLHRLVPLLLSPNKADLEFLVGLVGEGKLRTVVDSRFPLGDAAKAWQKSIDGHATGKIVVEMEG
ncbi:hypothetical protein OsJ_14476 [Oryza sativa Japonica Group]|uniref:Enoyl reductase (ER) domain-containing protein n=1 Tax=Oryza sativa subsp. japonica TaxID=39947 RepID=B9FER6_ORYSJ|nr:hypothetical protein OsJ_14476 [Oryza sativa Japonica Group]